ncbi:MAG: phosphate:nucleotide phosphotransferase [Micrococcaceae bacterium]|nr:phosphate:nucleotide phosphotransferase [Micrococcaceae bacterium]
MLAKGRAVANKDRHTFPADLLKVGTGFRLADVDAAGKPGFAGGKRQGKAVLHRRAEVLAGLQEKLYASGRSGGDRSLLLVLQAMDTAGKGGMISHVVGSVDPQGVQLSAFKAPTAEEKSHDFLWRIRRAVPAPGMLGVFDRSHYEDVLIHRVHGWANAAELERRYEAIRGFEADLAASGTTILKVMLHISPEEQKARLLARLADPAKHWKYSTGDLTERLLWPQYMDAFQAAFEQTSAEAAPWFVVPANRKWYARLAVQELVIRALADMDLGWPAADFDVEAETRRIRES